MDVIADWSLRYSTSKVLMSSQTEEWGIAWMTCLSLRPGEELRPLFAETTTDSTVSLVVQKESFLVCSVVKRTTPLQEILDSIESNKVFWKKRLKPALATLKATTQQFARISYTVRFLYDRPVYKNEAVTYFVKKAKKYHFINYLFLVDETFLCHKDLTFVRALSFHSVHFPWEHFWRRSPYDDNLQSGSDLDNSCNPNSLQLKLHGWENDRGFLIS